MWQSFLVIGELCSRWGLGGGECGRFWVLLRGAGPVAGTSPLGEGGRDALASSKRIRELPPCVGSGPEEATGGHSHGPNMDTELPASAQRPERPPELGLKPRHEGCRTFLPALEQTCDNCEGDTGPGVERGRGRRAVVGKCGQNTDVRTEPSGPGDAGQRVRRGLGEESGGGPAG